MTVPETRQDPEAIADDRQVVPEVCRAPSYNYWAISDAHPMKRAVIDRYEIALGHVEGSVVDAACGWGYGTSMLAAEAGPVVGIDAWGRAIAYAQSVTAGRRGLRFIEADLEVEGVPDHFDWAVCFETLEHLKDPEGFAAKLKAAARKGICVSVPPARRKSARNNPFHEREIEWDSLEQWFKGWDLAEKVIIETDLPNGRRMDISVVGVWTR